MRVRIIAGEFGGRFIQAPPGSTTHPMGERVRSAMFNSLGETVRGARVLDAFTGSDTIGLEALSRDAESMVLVERSRAAQCVIAEKSRSLRRPVSCTLTRPSRPSPATWQIAMVGPNDRDRKSVV